MKTIGLLGGMSWVSTEHYYRLINSEVAQRLGGESCASMVVWQSDFAHIAQLQRDDKWHEAGEVLAEGTRSLTAAGAEVIAICANTMHLVADQVVGAADGAPLVHIVEAVRDECQRLGITRLGLFGTAYTMESPTLFPPTLHAAGIEMIVPSEADRELVQRITYDELVRDVVN